MQQLRREIEELGRKHSEVNVENNKEVDKIVSEVQQLDEQLHRARYKEMVNRTLKRTPLNGTECFLVLIAYPL